MKEQKALIITLVGSIALVVLLVWSFYETLQAPESHGESIPEKAVMAQARALTKQQFDRFAEHGIVVAGMTPEQVEQALGQPSQKQTIEENGSDIVVWWYENESRYKVIFGSNDVVRSAEKL